MTRLIPAWFISVVFAAETAASQQACHTADQNSARFIKVMNAMMDTSRAAFRAKLQIPLVTSSAITLVTDPAVCAQAGFAADSIFKVRDPTAVLDPTSDPIYVIKVGSSYAVADLNHTDDDDEYAWVFVFGPLWEYRGSMAM